MKTEKKGTRRIQNQNKLYHVCACGAED